MDVTGNSKLVPGKLEQASLLQQQGRLAEAERIYREVVQQHPGHFEAIHQLGIIAARSGRMELACELIAKAIAIDPKVASAHSNLGVVLRNLRRPEQALASHDRAIALEPAAASAHYNRGNLLLELKRAADALASFDRAIAINPNVAEVHGNRGNALRELQRPQEALASFDRAIALKPDLAEAHSNRGNALLDLKRDEEALESFNRAIALKPDFADAHSSRGVALKNLKRFDEALASLNRAIAQQPDFAEAFSNRGNVLQDLRRFDEAMADQERAVALNPRYAEGYVNRGITLLDLMRPEEALADFGKAIAMRPEFVDARWNHSLCLLLLGRFEQGWRAYEWRKRRPGSSSARSYPQPLWLGDDDLAGKTIFLHWEQGLGDTIQFCRYAPLIEASGAAVILSVQSSLVGLLKQLSPTIRIIGPNEVPEHFDCYCPLMSLPLAFRTTIENLPAVPRYLVAPAERRTLWSQRLPTKIKPRIGLVWSGSTIHRNDHNRSIELRQLLPALVEEAEWFCLQREIRDNDLPALKSDGRIAVLADQLNDFSDTAALVERMDLVITIDTSVAHLAGALGKPVWILLPHNPDWRWLLERRDTPWYPSARLFRQREPGNWSEVVAEVKGEVQQFCAQWPKT